MVAMGSVAKTTHKAAYGVLVGTYGKLSFSVHNFDERWLGVTTRVKAASLHDPFFRPIWQQRWQIKGISVRPQSPISPLVSVLLLIGLVGCSRDRGELALKKTPTLIDEDACENREPKALAVVEMAETMGRVPIHPSHGENDCPENLRVGEQDTDDILLVGASRPALVFITPSLSPMPIMPPPSSLPEQVPMRQKPSPPLPADAPATPRPQIIERATPPKDPVPTKNEPAPTIQTAIQIVANPEMPSGDPKVADEKERLPQDQKLGDKGPLDGVVTGKPAEPNVKTPPVIPKPDKRKIAYEKEVNDIGFVEPEKPVDENLQSEIDANDNLKADDLDTPAEDEQKPEAKRFGAAAVEDVIADDDGAENDDGAKNDVRSPSALTAQNQNPIVGPSDHSGATTPQVILGTAHLDPPSIASSHGDVVYLGTGGWAKNPQIATLGQGVDHIIYSVGVGKIRNGWQPSDGAQKILNFDIGTDKLWFKQGGAYDGWIHDIKGLLSRILQGTISYVTADSGTDGNPDDDIITSVVVAGPKHKPVNGVIHQIELHFHQPDDQRAAFDIYSQKLKGDHQGSMATFIEIMGDSFGMLNDWNDLGYDAGTLPSENLPVIL